jgi:hypothetical protein
MAFYIEKIKVPARVWLPHESPIEGSFSLLPKSAAGTPAETIIERLNCRDRVVPFRRDKDAAVLLLNRLDIEMVEPMRGVPDDMVRPAGNPITREERVQVKLDSGKEISGRLLIELPDGLNRASDFLNGPEDWFALVTPEGIHLVNKARVRVTRVMEQSPRPLAMDDERGGKKA